MPRTVTLSSKGQIVIPKYIRKLLKLSEGDKLSIMFRTPTLLRIMPPGTPERPSDEVDDA